MDCYIVHEVESPSNPVLKAHVLGMISQNTPYILIFAISGFKRLSIVFFDVLCFIQIIVYLFSM